MTTALIIVDVQNDFLPGGALAVPDGDAVVPIINRLVPTVDLVVATQDWHPPDHGSFAANHDDAEVGQVIELHGLDQILWPTHCVQDSPGAAFASGLVLPADVEIVRKGTDRDVDSYSGFFDNGRRHATGLHTILEQRGVTRVCVTGLATDYCVKFTARDAASLGLETVLVEDGCRGVNLNDGDVDRAVEELRHAGVKVVSSDELLGTATRG